ncbi:UPF0301 protein [Trichinella spiralis]|uniref:UPF0301 protein n=1 Tax=Trichinella spiralis TaxID=6334 RepID=A0ABR3KFB3_TRISP
MFLMLRGRVHVIPFIYQLSKTHSGSCWRRVGIFGSRTLGNVFWLSGSDVPLLLDHLHVLHQGSSIFELRVSRSSKKLSIFSIASLMSTIGQRFSPSRSVCALFHYPKEAVQKSQLLQSMKFCFSETVPSAKSVAVFEVGSQVQYRLSNFCRVNTTFTLRSGNKKHN